MNTKHRITSLLMISTLLMGCATIALAQTTWDPTIVTQPASSAVKAADLGVRAHTNLLYLGAGPATGATPQRVGPPFGGYFYETPASIACVYDLEVGPLGCNPNSTFANPTGGRGAVAIVDAFDDPAATSDLQHFSTQFGLAAPNFTVVYAPFGGATPGSCTGPATQPLNAVPYGWDLEEALDIQYAHAMAPLATLYLVEAQTNSYSDLLCAVTVAGNLVRAAGGGDVSMSWGGGEFSVETSLDSVFTAPGVVYFASSGDGPGVIFPSASPNVIGVGGTTFATNPTTGHFEQEVTWVSAGGGLSRFESRPVYQNGIVSTVGVARGVPDVAGLADPYTGVWVLDTANPSAAGWYIVGGTSVASPLWAGMVNAAGSLSASTNAELTKVYGDSPWSGDFYAITAGVCGPYMGYLPTVGQSWHLCTGLGSPRGLAGK